MVDTMNAAPANSTAALPNSPATTDKGELPTDRTSTDKDEIPAAHTIVSTSISRPASPKCFTTEEKGKRHANVSPTFSRKSSANTDKGEGPPTHASTVATFSPSNSRPTSPPNTSASTRTHAISIQAGVRDLARLTALLDKDLPPNLPRRLQHLKMAGLDAVEVVEKARNDPKFCAETLASKIRRAAGSARNDVDLITRQAKVQKLNEGHFQNMMETAEKIAESMNALAQKFTDGVDPHRHDVTEPADDVTHLRDDIGGHRGLARARDAAADVAEMAAHHAMNAGLEIDVASDLARVGYHAANLAKLAQLGLIAISARSYSRTSAVIGHATEVEGDLRDAAGKVLRATDDRLLRAFIKSKILDKTEVVPGNVRIAGRNTIARKRRIALRAIQCLKVTDENGRLTDENRARRMARALGKLREVRLTGADVTALEITPIVQEVVPDPPVFEPDSKVDLERFMTMMEQIYDDSTDSSSSIPPSVEDFPHMTELPEAPSPQADQALEQAHVSIGMPQTTNLPEAPSPRVNQTVEQAKVPIHLRFIKFVKQRFAGSPDSSDFGQSDEYLPCTTELSRAPHVDVPITNITDDDVYKFLGDSFAQSWEARDTFLGLLQELLGAWEKSQVRWKELEQAATALDEELESDSSVILKATREPDGAIAATSAAATTAQEALEAANQVVRQLVKVRRAATTAAPLFPRKNVEADAEITSTSLYLDGVSGAAKDAQQAVQEAVAVSVAAEATDAATHMGCVAGLSRAAYKAEQDLHDIKAAGDYIDEVRHEIKGSAEEAASAAESALKGAMFLINGCRLGLEGGRNANSCVTDAIRFARSATEKFTRLKPKLVRAFKAAVLLQYMTLEEGRKEDVAETAKRVASASEDLLENLDAAVIAAKSLLSLSQSARPSLVVQLAWTHETTAALNDLATAHRYVRLQFDDARSASAGSSKVGRIRAHGIVGAGGETVGLSLFSHHNLFVMPTSVVSRRIHFGQGDFTHDQWIKIQEFFYQRGTRVGINLSTLNPDIVGEKDWFDDFIEQVMRGERHAIYAYVPGGRADKEKFADHLVRALKVTIFHRRHVVGDLTTAMLFMKLKGNQHALETFFFKDPTGISDDIRRHGLGTLLGTYVTRRLISKLFDEMGDGEGDGLEESVAAANLLVGLMRGSSRVRHLLGTNQQSYKIDYLYDFLADVRRASNNIRLNACRLGIVYGSLVAYAGDVRHEKDENAHILQTGIRASTAVLSATAEIAMRTLTPVGTTLVPGAIKEIGDLLVESVENSKTKSTAYTNYLIKSVTETFRQIIYRNRAAKRIPGYYGHPNDEEFDAYEKEANNVFNTVSMVLLDVPVVPQESSQMADKVSDLVVKLIPGIAKAATGTPKG